MVTNGGICMNYLIGIDGGTSATKTVLLMRMARSKDLYPVNIRCTSRRMAGQSRKQRIGVTRF